MRVLSKLRPLHRFLCICAALFLALPASAADGVESSVMAIQEVARGQRGYGLSVFEGGEVERFEVEILGTWNNLEPQTSYVLAKLSGQNLEETGVIAGMSGSPVYIDGKLLGAVSFGWPFSVEPIAGITPVENMRGMLGFDPGRPPSTGSSEPLALSTLIAARSDATDLRRALGALKPPRVGEAPVAVELAMGGFGIRAQDLLNRVLGPTLPVGALGVIGSAELSESGAVGAAAGSGSTGSLEPGEAVAAVLVNGDLKLAATGTVTDRQGDEVLAFGHPFLGLGAIEIPMAAADVVTVISSRLNSFKIANMGPVVGAVDFDHQTGIRGVLGKEARTIPMRIAVGGGPLRIVELTLADLPSITPALAAISMLGSLGSGLPSIGLESLDLTVEFDLGDQGRLTADQSFDGAGADLAAAIQVFSYASYVLNNRLENVEIEAIDVALEPYRSPRGLTVKGAHASRTVVSPGDKIQVNVDLAAYRGDSLRRSLDLTIPTNLRSGRYSLLVGDGVSTDVARLTLEQFEPANFRQAVEFLNSLHSRRELRVLGLSTSPGLAVGGEVLPDLPGSIRSLWSAAGSSSARPLQMGVVQEEGLMLEEPIEGIVRIDLEVKRRAPLGSDRSGPDQNPTDPQPNQSSAGPPAESEGDI